MASLNRVLIIGNLGSDPEMRFMPNGNPVCSIRVATNRYFTTPEGDKKEEVEWFTIVTFSKLAENCNQYLQKGSRIYAEGRLHTRHWEKDGQDHYRTEVIANQVIFLDKKSNQAPVEDNDIEPEDIPF